MHGWPSVCPTRVCYTAEINSILISPKWNHLPAWFMPLHLACAQVVTTSRTRRVAHYKSWQTTSSSRKNATTMAKVFPAEASGQFQKCDRNCLAWIICWKRNKRSHSRRWLTARIAVGTNSEETKVAAVCAPFARKRSSARNQLLNKLRSSELL